MTLISNIRLKSMWSVVASVSALTAALAYPTSTPANPQQNNVLIPPPIVPPPIIPPPVIDPNPTSRFGPGLPYFSGRFGRADAPSDPPVGAVVPDDFCLPGKYEDCGDHLRDSDSFTPETQDGPQFVDAAERSAFGSSQYAGWAEAKSRQTEMSVANENYNQTSYAIGADRLFGNNFVLGVMAQGNNATTDFTATNVRDSERGFLVGPYFAYQMSENIILDGRIGYGNSDHTVRTAGVVSGNYKSNGGFASLRVSGKMNRGNWRLSPSLEIANEFDSSDAYVDTVAGAVAASTSSQTFLTASVLAYYEGFGVGGGGLSPYLGLEATQQLDGGDLFGTVRAGAAMTLGNGTTINFDFGYGAIGLNNVTDKQISLRVEIPL